MTSTGIEIDNIPVEIYGVDGGVAMRGKIRSKEMYCPKCNQKFKTVEYVAIFCPDCRTRPRSFYVFVYWQKRDWKLYRDLTGRLLRSYEDARDLLREVSQKIEAGTIVMEHYFPKISDEYRCRSLLKRWRATKTHLAPTTLREMDRYVNKYFEPFFGPRLAVHLKTADVEDFYLSLPGHLSLKTKRNVMICLKTFFNWLSRRETLGRIPVFPSIDVPEVPIHVISRETMARAIEALDAHHRPIFRFMMLHPVRTGEARALKVKDFDLNAFTVHIERAFSLKELRSRKNKRDYYLPIHRAFDISILRGKLPEAWVFTNKTGQPYSSEGLRKLWHRARVKVGIPEIKLYNATRHSFATAALSDGHSLEIISKALGHADRKSVEKYAKHSVELLRGMFTAPILPQEKRVEENGQ